MKRVKQERLLWLLRKGSYKADTEMGCVYTFRKRKRLWEALIGFKDSSGFRQIELSMGPGIISDRLKIYEHVAVFIAGHGLIPENATIIHRDGDISNNKLWNLDMKVIDPPAYSLNREGKINHIHDLWENGERNHTRIAEAVMMNRQAVRRICLQLSSGEKDKTCPKELKQSA
jgi:hypothetical protein